MIGRGVREKDGEMRQRKEQKRCERKTKDLKNFQFVANYGNSALGPG